MSHLKIVELKAGYKRVPVLHNISFCVEKGEIIAIVGSNGAGKTTTLKTVSGLLHPNEGKILLEGEPINGLAPHIVVEKGIIQVPEGRHLFGYLTVEQNLQAGSYFREARKNRKETFNIVFSLFPILAERRSQLARTLSGGEQQMLATARALMGCPKLLMMDEPSWGLAPMLVRHLFSTITQINKTGCTILIVEQHVYQALSISQRAYVMEKGNIVMEGSSPSLLVDERLKETYLGV